METIVHSSDAELEVHTTTLNDDVRIVFSVQNEPNTVIF